MVASNLSVTITIMIIVIVTERIEAMIKTHESNVAHSFNSSHMGLLDVGLQQIKHIPVNSIKLGQYQSHYIDQDRKKMVVTYRQY